ncbi:MAG: hypothetical protein JOZ05_09865 [Acetobacteraceae bacterium]|nr:hypothetical protein [Acetobacteraceae bacterium]
MPVKKRRRWTKIGSALVTIAVLITAGGRLWSMYDPPIAKCYEDRTTDALRDIVKEHTSTTLVSVDDQTEQAGGTDEHVACTAKFTFGDGHSERIAYAINKEHRTSIVRFIGEAAD